MGIAALVSGLVTLIPDYSAQAYEKALVQFESGQYADTIEVLDAVLARNPSDLSSRVLIGLAYQRLGHPENAEQELRHALHDGADGSLVLPPLARTYLEQGKLAELLTEINVEVRDPDLKSELLTVHGLAYLQLRRLTDAQRLFDRAMESTPDAPGPVLGQAMVELQMGRVDRAVKLAAHAAQIAPEHADVWFTHGEIARQQRRLEEAAKQYDRVVEMAPHHLQARRQRALVLVELNEDRRALEDLQAIWRVREDDPQANYLYAVMLSKLGEVERAQQVLERAAISLSRYRTEYVMQHPPSLLLLGVIHYKNTQFDRAYPLLDRYLQVEPHHAGARKMVGSILLMRNLPTAAIDALNPLLDSDPTDPELLSLLSQAFTQNQQPERANLLLEKAAALAPNRADIHAQLALTRLTGNRDTDAVAEFEQALSLGGSTENTGVLLGLLQIKQGDFDGALVTAVALANRQPDNPAVHNLVGAVHLAQGELDAAERSFSRALDLDPDYLIAYHNIAKLDLKAGRADDAEEGYRAILVRDADDTAAMIGIAKVARADGRPADAAVWLEKARKVDPKLFAAQLDLIDLYLRTGKVVKARIVVEDLDRLFPRSVPVRIAKGRVELAAGEPEKASVIFRALSVEQASAPERLYRMVEYQLAVNDLDGARESLQKVLESDPDFMPAHRKLVNLALLEGKRELAITQARRLQDSHPDNSLGYRLSAEILLEDGQAEAAISTLLSGLRITRDSELAVRLYRARRSTGEGVQALVDLERWAAANPGTTAARRALAEGYLESGRYQEALAEHQALIELEPEDPLLNANLAHLYVKASDPRAREFAETAYRLAPRDPASLDALGWVLVHGDEVAEGLKLLREAFNRSAKDMRIRFHIAVALTRLGRDNEARRELKRVIAAEQEFDGLERAKALLDQLTSG